MPPENADDLSTLERMRRRLYANEAPEATVPESPSTTPHVVSQEGWAPPVPRPVKKRSISLAALFLGIAGAFFLIALIVAAYFLIFGGRSVSTDNINIVIEAPTEMASGDALTIPIRIENKNPVAVTATSLMVDFPDTARAADDTEKAFPFYEDTVGDIQAGDTGTQSVQVVLYGGENERIRIPVKFEYRIEGSNATYVKESVHEVLITSSPLSIRAEAVSEASVGHLLSFAVTVRSNASEPIENVAVRAEYPFGFSPRTGEGPVYTIGTLAPGEERTITITGTLTGENTEERVFRFTSGIQQGTAKTLAISYSTAVAPVTIAKPFLATTLSINRDQGTDPVIQSGSSVQGVVSWINSLSTSILDGQIEVRLSGSALDTTSISAFDGYYRSSDGTLIYSRENSSALARIDPGASGSGSFGFRTKSADAIASLRNPTITATVSVAGRRVGESNVPERISDVITRTIKIGTDLSLSAKSTYSAGPRPPIADQETTYALTLTLANSVNTVADAVVTGTLPSYVRYVRATNPSDGSVSFNEVTRVVTWRVGEVAAGAGYGGPARAATIEVVLLPSVSQRGTSPILMSSPTVTGVDRFTQKQLSSTEAAVTTQPAVGTGMPVHGIVQ